MKNNIKILWSEIVGSNLIGAAFLFLLLSFFVTFVSPQLGLAFWAGGVTFGIVAGLYEKEDQYDELPDVLLNERVANAKTKERGSDSCVPI